MTNYAHTQIHSVKTIQRQKTAYIQFTDVQLNSVPQRGEQLAKHIAPVSCWRLFGQWFLDVPSWDSCQ